MLLECRHRAGNERSDRQDDAPVMWESVRRSDAPLTAARRRRGYHWKCKASKHCHAGTKSVSASRPRQGRRSPNLPERTEQGNRPPGAGRRTPTPGRAGTSRADHNSLATLLHGSTASAPEPCRAGHGAGHRRTSATASLRAGLNLAGPGIGDSQRLAGRRRTRPLSRFRIQRPALAHQHPTDPPRTSNWVTQSHSIPRVRGILYLFPKRGPRSTLEEPAFALQVDTRERGMEKI